MLLLLIRSLYPRWEILKLFALRINKLSGEGIPLFITVSTFGTPCVITSAGAEGAQLQ